MIVLTYTHPDGTVETRVSKRAYTHVVLVQPKSAQAESVWVWSGSAANAEKKARQYRGWGHSARVAPVDPR
jgi:hypothetical protein